MFFWRFFYLFFTTLLFSPALSLPWSAMGRFWCHFFPPKSGFQLSLLCITLAKGIMGTKSPIWGTKLPFWMYQFWCLFAGIKWTLITCWIQPASLAQFFLVTYKCKLIHHPSCAWGRYWHRALPQREMFAPVHHLHHTWSFSWRYLWVFYVRTPGEGLGMENVAVRQEWFRYPWRHEITLHCHQHKEITLYKNN